MILLLLFSTISAFATDRYVYEYDANGNRTRSSLENSVCDCPCPTGIEDWLIVTSTTVNGSTFCDFAFELTVHEDNACYSYYSYDIEGIRCEAIGEIEIELFPELAPEHCRNFDSLVEIKFYDRTAFHRVIPKFMIQGGDPNSRDKDKSTWGQGDPSQRKIPAEFSSELHLRGTLSAARTNDPNSATSQFFICVVPCPWLDGKYSIYGEVTSGMDVVDKIVNVSRNIDNDAPNEKVEMTITKKATSAEDLINPSSGAITIYPNPAKDMISLRSASNAAISSIQIINLNGKAVFTEEFSKGTMLNDVRLNLTNLNTGLYLMRIFKADGSVSRLKVMISK